MCIFPQPGGASVARLPLRRPAAGRPGAAQARFELS
jgi:hypothetical protein